MYIRWCLLDIMVYLTRFKCNFGPCGFTRYDTIKYNTIGSDDRSCLLDCYNGTKLVRKSRSFRRESKHGLPREIAVFSYKTEERLK